MTTTEKINHLFKHLLRVHKSLLDFQRLVMESLDQKKYSPYEALQMAINHPDFAWLRKISGVMALMDEATSDKKNPPDEDKLKDFVRLLNDLFTEATQDPDFKRRFDIAVSRDANLAKQVAELKAEIAALK